MSEDPSAYTSREFICENCKRVFIPTQQELEALEGLEKRFGLPPEMVSLKCAECAKKVE